VCVCVCVCVLVTTVSRAKTVELIKIPFGLWPRRGRANFGGLGAVHGISDAPLD